LSEIRNIHWLSRLISSLNTIFHSNSTTRQLIFTTATNVALMLLGMLTGVLLARELGPDGRGELAAIQLWPALLATVAMFGLPEALGYYSASDKSQTGKYVSTATGFALLSSLAFMLAAYAVLPALLSAQSPSTIYYSRLYLLLLPLMAIAGIPPHALRGLGQLGPWNLLRLLPTLGWLAVIGVAACLRSSTPQFLTVGYLAVLALLALPINAFVYSHIAPPRTIDPRLGKRLARFGLPSMLSSVPQLFNLRLDQLIMASILPLDLLGLYVVAVAWSGGLTPLLTSLGFVLFPKIASQPNLDLKLQVLTRGARICIVAGVVLCILMIPVTPMLLPALFGRPYLEAVPSSMILIVGAALLGFNYLLEEGLRALGRPAAVLWAELSGLAASAAGLLILLPRFGALGAAVASLCAYGFITTVLLVLLRRYTGCRPSHFFVPTRSDFEFVYAKAQMRQRHRTQGPPLE
jgi:O-antigen/teichoic acid export membrane protein